MCIVIKVFEKSDKNAMIFIIFAYALVKIVYLVEYSVSTPDILIQNTKWVAFENNINAIISTITICMVISILLNKPKLAMLLMVGSFGITSVTRAYIWESNVKENNLYYIPEYSVIGAENNELKDILEVNKYILDKEKEGYEVKILDIVASKYMIPLHRNNYKFDLMLNGNLGYNGEERLIEEIKSIENLIILRQKPEIETIKIQQPEEIDKFIEENYEKIGEINNLEVYN